MLPSRSMCDGPTFVTMPDFRLRDVAQQRDLAARPHAHLQHGALVPRRRLEQHQRQADLAVEVAFVLQHVIADVQHRRRQFLRRRLADAAGDGDDLQLRPRRASQPREVLQAPPARAARRTARCPPRPAARRSRRSRRAAPHAPTKSWPSTCSPRSATKMSPRPALRESTTACRNRIGPTEGARISAGRSAVAISFAVIIAVPACLRHRVVRLPHPHAVRRFDVARVAVAAP